MKRLLISSLLSLIAVYSYSQCDAYFNFEEGAEYEMTHYSAKDKISGKSLSQIISIYFQEIINQLFLLSRKSFAAFSEVMRATVSSEVSLSSAIFWAV